MPNVPLAYVSVYQRMSDIFHTATIIVWQGHKIESAFYEIGLYQSLLLTIKSVWLNMLFDTSLCEYIDMI